MSIIVRMRWLPSRTGTKNINTRNRNHEAAPGRAVEIAQNELQYCKCISLCDCLLPHYGILPGEVRAGTVYGLRPAACTARRGELYAEVLHRGKLDAASDRAVSHVVAETYTE